MIRHVYWKKIFRFYIFPLFSKAFEIRQVQFVKPTTVTIHSTLLSTNYKTLTLSEPILN